MIDFDKVNEFYEADWCIGHYKFMKCELALANLKTMFPNIKWVFVQTSISQEGFIAYNPPTVENDCLDMCSRNYIIVTDEGKVIALGTSEWGHLEEAGTDGFKEV